MNPLKLSAVGVALSATLGSTPAAAPQRRVLDFTLVNGTNHIFMQLYVSPARDGRWGGDVLGDEILRPGQETEVSFSRTEPTCMWDLKIVNEEKHAREWRKLNLCEASRITLKVEQGKPTAVVR